jgi:16S rRNA A1518/A1519 N6-dimethyltransferase RsmA/KsgA/DIM1 with predicted DNA glycosylase/AP lyase activity
MNNMLVQLFSNLDCIHSNIPYTIKNELLKEKLKEEKIKSENKIRIKTL